MAVVTMLILAVTAAVNGGGVDAGGHQWQGAARPLLMGASGSLIPTPTSVALSFRLCGRWVLPLHTKECGSSMRSEGSLVHCEPLKSQPKGSCLLPDEEIDLESGELELKVHKEEKTCRICHLSLLKCGGIGDDDQLLEPSGGTAIELGCSCKGDLAAAHKQCALKLGSKSGKHVECFYYMIRALVQLLFS
ncbi:hypothetical protein HAX54_025212 [Datura stramonium]|uniref:RING-CH-type domain-containing protein n=1 Tax=Datura stramonium TaxID=4076 RepID=A0ABS8S7P8_DATST|nr:hypothetical protein [Datura stramonium]